MGTEIPGTWNAWEIWQFAADGAPSPGTPDQFFGDQAQWEVFLTDKDYDPVSN